MFITCVWMICARSKCSNWYIDSPLLCVLSFSPRYFFGFCFALFYIYIKHKYVGCCSFWWWTYSDWLTDCASRLFGQQASIEHNLLRINYELWCIDRTTTTRLPTNTRAAIDREILQYTQAHQHMQYWYKINETRIRRRPVASWLHHIEVECSKCNAH